MRGAVRSCTRISSDWCIFARSADSAARLISVSLARGSNTSSNLLVAREVRIRNSNRRRETGGRGAHLEGR